MISPLVVRGGSCGGFPSMGGAMTGPPYHPPHGLLVVSALILRDPRDPCDAVLELVAARAGEPSVVLFLTASHPDVPAPHCLLCMPQTLQAMQRMSLKHSRFLS
jgi:hypothetical protein